MTAVREMTTEELFALPVRVPIRTAAAALRIGQGEAYRLAEAGEFPVKVHRLAGALVVNRADILRELGYDPHQVRASEPVSGGME